MGKNMPKGYKHNMKVRKLNEQLKEEYQKLGIKPTHKYCNKCEELLLVDSFIKSEKNIFGYLCRCRKCDAEYKQHYATNNKELLKLTNAARYEKNKDNPEYKSARKNSYEKRKPKRNEDQKIKYSTDMVFKTKHNLRTSLTKFMNGAKTKSSNEYGIDWNKCIEYLDEPPEYISKPSIDHIIPCNAFDFLNPEHPKLCYFPENLRWLEWDENCSKSDRIYPSLIRSFNLEWICKEIGLDLDSYADGELLRVKEKEDCNISLPQ